MALGAIRGRAARLRLVHAARAVFERDGFLRARIADICAEAGLAQPSFYAYFHSKEEIFDEVVDSVELELLSMPQPGRTMDQRSGSALRTPQYGVPSVERADPSVIDEMGAFDSHIRDVRAERHEQFARAIARRIKALQEAGDADERVDPYFAANSLGGMVPAMARHLYLDRTGQLPKKVSNKGFEKAVEQLTLLWDNAIGLKP